MREDIKDLLNKFFNWIIGNGPRPENEILPPEPPPDLPFTRRNSGRKSRFHEASINERYNEWVELHGLHIFSSLYTWMSVLTCLVIILLLLITVTELPPFGDEHNPANNEVVLRYIKTGARETGAKNIVAGMILDYRAFDTFGESAVLFTAAVSVLMLLGASRRNRTCEKNIFKFGITSKSFLQRGPPLRVHIYRQDDMILRGIASISIPTILVMGCAIIINGHLTPGGGFSGGAVLSTALILAANAYGFDHVHYFFNERTFIFSSSGSLIIYALAKGYSFFTGANHIPSGIPTGTIGNILSGGLILPLNICVGIVVAGTLYSFYALFSEGDI